MRLWRMSRVLLEPFICCRRQRKGQPALSKQSCVIIPGVDTLRMFTGHFGISPASPPEQLLQVVVAAFSRLPYENITKIIKHSEQGNAERARRYPAEVIRDHIAWGTGGTCFSLASALRHLLRGLGWEAEYLLADRRYGQNTHCALLIWINGAPHLLDPGFLIVKPVPLSNGTEKQFETGFNRIVLTPEKRSDRIELSTAEGAGLSYRLTYKTSPVDEGEFLKAWDDSFEWDMMRYPLLTRAAPEGRIYLRGSRLRITGNGRLEKRELSGDGLTGGIAAAFGIDPSVVARALSILREE